MAAKRSRQATLEARIVELEAALQRALAANEALRGVGMAIGTTLDLDELLELILSTTTEVLEADRATLYLLEGDKLVSRVFVGPEAVTIEVDVGQGIAGHVARTGRPLRVRDAYRDKRFDRDWDKVTGYRTRSILAVPLKNHLSKTVGVIQVLNKRGTDGQPTAFTAYDTALLKALAAQAAVALDKSQLFRSLFLNNEQLSETKDRLERSLADLELLYQLETEMNQAETHDDLARRVVTLTGRACKAAAGALLVEGTDGTLTLHVVRLDRPKEVRQVVVQPGEGVAARAMQRQELVTVDSPRHLIDPTRVQELVGMNVRSAVAAPLMAKGQRPAGAVALYNHGRRAAPFADIDGSLLRLVSANVSTQLLLMRARGDRERQDRLTSIGRLLSGVMHDLRTPLTVISGYVQLMEVSDDPALRQDYAATIQGQFEVIAAMQRDLLAYARGETSVLLRKVYLVKFCDDLKRQLEQEVADTAVTLELDVQDTGTAIFDEGKLARVMLNLARNGMEAMEAKGGTLTLGCRREHEDVLLTVSDTGSGIPASIRDTLFDPFVTSGKRMGTGLGLAIVRRILDEHGGDIDVKTSKRGTSFAVRLPQAVAPHSRRPGSLRP